MSPDERKEKAREIKRLLKMKGYPTLTDFAIQKGLSYDLLSATVSSRRTDPNSLKALNLVGIDVEEM